MSYLNQKFKFGVDYHLLQIGFHLVNSSSQKTSRIFNVNLCYAFNIFQRHMQQSRSSKIETIPNDLTEGFQKPTIFFLMTPNYIFSARFPYFFPVVFAVWPVKGYKASFAQPQAWAASLPLIPPAGRVEPTSLELFKTEKMRYAQENIDSTWQLASLSATAAAFCETKMKYRVWDKS